MRWNRPSSSSRSAGGSTQPPDVHSGRRTRTHAHLPEGHIDGMAERQWASTTQTLASQPSRQLSNAPWAQQRSWGGSTPPPHRVTEPRSSVALTSYSITPLYNLTDAPARSRGHTISLASSELPSTPSESRPPDRVLLPEQKILELRPGVL